METKIKIELDDRWGKEYAGEYVFTMVPWARLNAITQRNVVRSRRGEVIKINLVNIQAETIWEALERGKHCPKGLTLEKLKDQEHGIPPALGDWLLKHTDKVNGGEEQKNSSPR